MATAEQLARRPQLPSAGCPVHVVHPSDPALEQALHRPTQEHPTSFGLLTVTGILWILIKAVFLSFPVLGYLGTGRFDTGLSTNVIGVLLSQYQEA